MNRQENSIDDEKKVHHEEHAKRYRPTRDPKIKIQAPETVPCSPQPLKSTHHLHTQTGATKPVTPQVFAQLVHLYATAQIQISLLPSLFEEGGVLPFRLELGHNIPESGPDPETFGPNWMKQKEWTTRGQVSVPPRGWSLLI